MAATSALGMTPTVIFVVATGLAVALVAPTPAGPRGSGESEDEQQHLVLIPPLFVPSLLRGRLLREQLCGREQ
jgi:hypothetical protein